MVNPLFYTIAKQWINQEPIVPSILPLPIKLAFPFDIYTSMLRFIVTYWISFFAILLDISILAFFDSFYLTLINYSSSFFSIVKVKLNNLHNAMAEPNSSKQILADMKNIVESHCIAIDIVDQLETISHLFMIIQFMSSTLLFCVVGFQLSIVRRPFVFRLNCSTLN